MLLTQMKLQQLNFLSTNEVKILVTCIGLNLVINARYCPSLDFLYQDVARCYVWCWHQPACSLENVHQAQHIFSLYLVLPPLTSLVQI